MATGYDNRQGGRETFAFRPPQPAQAQPSRSGVAHRDAQVVGGRSQGGAVTTANETTPGPMAAGLGEFFGELMRPYVERRQKEQFLKGWSEQAARQGVDEIRASKSPINQIFGPSSYEEGAIFFTAQKATSDAVNEITGDMDTVQQMNSTEFAKLLGDRLQSLETGDRFTDAAVQQGFFTAAQPLIEVQAKANYAWRQREATKAWTGFASSKAAGFGALGRKLADLSDATDSDLSAAKLAYNDFLGAMQKPEGMDDRTYIEAVKSFIAAQAQDGNGFAASALMEAGFARVLDEDDQIKLEDRIERYGRKSQAQLLADPDIREKLTLIDAAIATGNIENGALGAQAMLDEVNGLIKRRSGFNMDVFDADDIRQVSRGVISAAVASERRREDRQNQINDMLQKREWEQEDREADEAQGVVLAQTAWSTGKVRSAIAAGATESDVNTLALQAYQSGDFEALSRAVSVEAWVSSDVANMMQNKVAAAGSEEEYTKGFEAGYKEWSTLNKLNGVAAARYYGNWHQRMQAFERFTNSGFLPQDAYRKAFGDASIYGTASVPAQHRQQVEKFAKQAVKDTSVWNLWGYNPWRRNDLNAISERVVANSLTNRLAIDSKNSDLPLDQLWKQTLRASEVSGELERAGQYVWRNRAGTDRLDHMLGMFPQDFDNLMEAVINGRLRRHGWDGKTPAAVERRKGPDGKPMLTLTVIRDGVEPLVVPVSWPMIQAGAKAYVDAKVGENQPRSTGKPFKPNRVMRSVIQQNRDAVQGWGK